MEIADREAVVDEAEDDLDPDEETDEDEEEAAEEEAADAEPSLEAQLKQFERENVRHERAIAKIMGDDFAAFEVCPGCDSLGFRPLGAIQYDRDLETCDTCKGHGFLLTGAVREDRVVRECIDCQGNGYRVHIEMPAAAAPAPTMPEPSFDPYTGQRIVPGAAPAQPNGVGWAPGYTPPGSPAPAVATGR
jgi:hypothetical protein